jgi:uncharacterized damage-inducible protein DinB
MNTQELGHQLEDVTADFLQLLEAVPQEYMNTIPFEGSWTVGQVANHIFKSDSYVLKSLRGPTKDIHREAGEKIEETKKVFLDFTKKLKSPKQIVPENKTYFKEELLTDLKKTRGEINQSIESLDLTVVCADPVLGDMTRLEIIHFVIYHTQRHIHQLRNITKEISILAKANQT